MMAAIAVASLAVSAASLVIAVWVWREKCRLERSVGYLSDRWAWAPFPKQHERSLMDTVGANTQALAIIVDHLNSHQRIIEGLVEDTKSVHAKTTDEQRLD